MNPSRPPRDNEIPSKFILICHSAGGLAAREYVTSSYYQGDVAKVITFATPHLGSTTGKAVVWAERNRDSRHLMPMLGMATAMFTPGLIKTTPGKALLAGSAVAFVNTWITDVLMKVMNKEDTPVVRDQLPQSPFLGGLNNRMTMQSTFEAPAYSLIAVRGVPTPPDVDDTTASLLSAVPFYRIAPILEALFGNELDTWDAKVAATNLMMLMGYPFTKNGDLISSASASQKGEGIPLLQNATRLEYTFRSPSIAALWTVADGLVGSVAFNLLPEPVQAPLLFALFVGAASAGMPDTWDYLFAHTTIKDKTALGERKDLISGVVLNSISTSLSKEDLDTSSLLDQALFESPKSGASSSSSLAPMSITLSTTTTRDASGNVVSLPEPATITPEAITESTDPGTGLVFNIDGRDRYVSEIKVKTPPTRIFGAIRDFMPLELKSFQVSENFAAWKDFAPVTKTPNQDPQGVKFIESTQGHLNLTLDEWGRFTLDGLKMAEGNNTIAFRFKNRANYESRQLLGIQLNQTPAFIANQYPQSGAHLQHATHIGFDCSTVTHDPNETHPGIISATLNGEDVTPQVQKVTTRGEDGHKITSNITLPLPENTTEGEYNHAITLQTNVGPVTSRGTFIVDRTPPTATIQPVQPYSPRAPDGTIRPLTVRYTLNDNFSPLLKDLAIKLTDANSDVIATITTAESIAMGEQVASWRPTAEELPPDGKYRAKLYAKDAAGNEVVSFQEIAIDSTAPEVLIAQISPASVNSKTEKLEIKVQTSEPSQVIANLKNKRTGEVRALFGQASKSNEERGMGNEGGAEAMLSLALSNPLSAPPPDGLYEIEVIARDSAGNASAPKQLQAVRIDRTPPEIASPFANPMALANTGNNRYQTRLTYKLYESRDAEENRNSEAQVKIKLFQEQTGELVTLWEAAPSQVGGAENAIDINFQSLTLRDGSPLPKGGYRLQITATDSRGNPSTAATSVVMDGIAPSIAYPDPDSGPVSGTIAIRGTATDPDWSNSAPFKEYRLYYAEGDQPAPANLEMIDAATWKSDLIEVPPVNRGSGTAKNIGIRPMQTDSTLAYLSTTGLPNGRYTLLLVASEDGGEALASRRVVEVQNEGASPASSPVVQLRDIPGEIEFKTDGSAKLPIYFVNSVKPANVHVEVVSEKIEQKGSEAKENPVVFYRYFPGVPGSPFIGKPEYSAGSELGYFIWFDDSGWHVRWSADRSPHKFSGQVILIGGSAGAKFESLQPLNASVQKLQDALITWDTEMLAGEAGFDFTAGAGELMFMPRLDDTDPAHPQIEARSVYLGLSRQGAGYLPIVADGRNAELIDLMSQGLKVQSKESGTTLAGQRVKHFVEWDGKLDTGALVDSGSYIIRVRAEGVDGVGVNVAEQHVTARTPFEVAEPEIVNREFDPRGALASLSLRYSLPKDAYVTAIVKSESGDEVMALARDQFVLGRPSQNTKYSLTWKGNRGSSDSAELVPAGTYSIEFRARPADGSGGDFYRRLDGITVTSFKSDQSVAELQPIGELKTLELEPGRLETIRVVDGVSPYFLKIRGEGQYYPPIPFEYSLTAQGRQHIAAYPYVPFAVLAHRGFRSVDTVVKTELHGTNIDDYYRLEERVFDRVRHGGRPFAFDSRVVTKSFTENSEAVVISDSGPRDRIPGHGGDLHKEFETVKITFQLLAERNNSLELDKITLDLPQRLSEEKSSTRILPFRKVPLTDRWGRSMAVYNRQGELVDGYQIVPPSEEELQAAAEALRGELWNQFHSQSAEPKGSEKGIFAVEFFDDEPEVKVDRRTIGGRWATGIEVRVTLLSKNRWDPFNYSYQARTRINNGIKYSRLTNRYVPWYGFVNANGTAYSFTGPGKLMNTREIDFSNFLENPQQGLGFPGKLFFTDPDTKLETSAISEMQIKQDLESAKEYSEKIKVLNQYANQANLLGYKDNLASIVGSESYLSDEFFNIIPITQPDRGDFEIKNTTHIIAKTSAKYDGKDGRPDSYFEFPWPLPDAKIAEFNQRQQTKKNDLLANPQSYSGLTPDGTFWELDETEISKRRQDFESGRYSTQIMGLKGLALLNRAAARQEWRSEKEAGTLLPLPEYVEKANYLVSSSSPKLRFSLAGGEGQHAYVLAEANPPVWENWATGEDPNLKSSDGLIQSPALFFNEKSFEPSGENVQRISDVYPYAESVPDPNDPKLLDHSLLKAAFWKRNPFLKDGDPHAGERLVDNPNLVIDGNSWSVSLLDRAGESNQDLSLSQREPIVLGEPSRAADDSVRIQLQTRAEEKKFVEIRGIAAGPYTLSYFDGGSWQKIAESPTDSSGRLAWWNTSRLNGKHQVLLKVRPSNGGEVVATQDVYVGQPIPKGASAVAQSAYKRAELKFETEAFKDRKSGSPVDQLVTITPVTISEITIRNRPLRIQTGPIVEIKPSPWQFEISSIRDLRPTLRFSYTKNDLITLNWWDDRNPGGNLNLNIHQVTAAGDLQVVATRQTIEPNGLYVFSGPMDHFSTYTLMHGRNNVISPIVLTDRDVTNDDFVTVYGTAQAGSIVTVHVVQFSEAVLSTDTSQATLTADNDTGSFIFEKVSLPYEGKNYIVVTSTLAQADIKTRGDTMVIRDKIPPKVDGRTTRYLFSPNGDGRRDSTTHEFWVSKDAQVQWSLRNPDGKKTAEFTFAGEAGKLYRVEWSGERVKLQMPTTEEAAGYRILQETGLSDPVRDGEYSASVTALDLAGNVSNALAITNVVDITPPETSLAARIKKFSPNGDGRKDRAEFSSSISEKGKLVIAAKGKENSYQFTASVGIPEASPLQIQWSLNGWKIEKPEGDVVQAFPGQSISEGSYIVNVYAEDPAENRSAIATAEVTADLTPPQLISKSISPLAFSPNGDGRKDTVTASFSLSEPADQTIRVRKSQSMASLFEKSIARQSEFIWDGSGDDRRVAADGQYVVSLLAEDEAGNRAEPQIGYVFVDTTPPTVTGSRQYGVFSPNGDGRRESNTFKLKSTEAGEMSLRIIAPDGKTALSTTESVAAGIDRPIVWAPATDPPPLEGLYTAGFSAMDEAGNESAPQALPTSIDITPPHAIASSSLKKFSPNNDGRKDDAEFLVATNEKGKLYFKLAGNNTSMAAAPDANYQLKWGLDGLRVEPDQQLAAGRYIPEGDYSFEVIAEDEAENHSAPTSLNVTADLTPPTIVAGTLSPNPFSPNGDGRKDETYVGASFSEPSKAHLLVMPMGGGVVYTTPLATELTLEVAGQWDGRAPDGRYLIRFGLEDEAGNIGVGDLGFVTVDTVPPIPTLATIPDIGGFSPNGDGRFDSMEYQLRSNEPGEILFSINNSEKLHEMVKAYEDKRFTWGGDTLPDGTYSTELVAEDLAGNRSRPVSGQTAIDTRPPQILAQSISPREFSPNGDGVQDSTTFSIDTDEKATAYLRIYREDEALFREASIPTRNSGAFTWDGRGNHGELLGGNFTWNMTAEDWVGNRTTGATDTLYVDRAAFLIQYAFSDPYEFSPISSRTGKTKIRYYLAKELDVDVSIVTTGEAIVKRLSTGTRQSRGEHTVEWDGSFDSEYTGVRVDQIGKVYDGSYTLRVTARDPAGEKPEISTATVLVDMQPPRLSLSKPVIDYAHKIVTFNYHIPEPAKIVLEARNASGLVVKRFLDGIEKKAGRYEIVWKYLEEPSLAPITAEPINIIGEAEDHAGNLDRSETPRYALLAGDELVAGISASPNPFTPNGDGTLDQTTIRYLVGGGAGDVRASLWVLNSTGTRVATIFQDELKARGSQTYVWDGRVSNQGPVTGNQGRTVLPDGEYQFELIVKDAAGTESSARTSVLLVSTKPTIQSSTSGSTFSPNGDGVKDTVTVTYTLNYPTQWITGEAQVVIEVLPTTGDPVARYQISQGVGMYTWVWGGRVPAGAYTIKVSGVDPLGTPAIPAQKVVKVDYGAPELATLDIQDSRFSPNGDGVKDKAGIVIRSERFSYLVVDIVNGTPAPAPVGTTEARTPGSIRSLSNGVVTVGVTPTSHHSSFLIPHSSPDLFTISLDWDGLNQAGILVPDGVYSAAVTSFNDAGNVTFSSATLEVDTVAPGTPILATLPANTNQSSQTASGTAEPNAMVEVFRGSTKIASASVDPTGRFNIPISLSLGAHQISAQAIDSAGNRSPISQALAVRYETDPPVIAIPTISPGIAKAGPVQIRFDVSETLSSAPAVSVNGNPVVLATSEASSYAYIYDVSDRDQQGTAGVTIEATDLAGNSASRTAQFTIDTVTPIAPTLASLPSFTNIPSITIQGTAEPASIVHLTQTGSSVAQTVDVTASSSGNFSKVISLYAGVNNFSATAEDSGRNVSAASSVGPLTYETGLPVVSNILITPDPARAGSVRIEFDVSEPLRNAPLVTRNSPELRITDYELRGGLHYRFRTTVTADDPQGATSVTIQVTDRAGNMATASASFMVDTRSPTFSNLSITPRMAKAGPVTLEFSSNESLAENPTLLVNREQAIFQSHNGNRYVYQYQVAPEAQQGTPSIEVAGIDPAGNSTTQALPAEDSGGLFVFDTITPAAPVLSELPPYTNTRSHVVTGSAEANSKVRVFRNGALLREISADPSGAISLPIQLLPGSNTITAEAEDAARNVSVSSQAVASNFETDIPVASNIVISPDPAKAGPVTISFDVSESLRENPVVRAGGIVAQLSQSSELHYQYQTAVAPDAVQGVTPVSIQIIDLSGNTGTDEAAFAVDTIAPEFRLVTITPAITSIGSVEVRFESSESLLSNPTVLFNSHPTSFVLNTRGTYRYRYNVAASERQGQPEITITGIDLAGNTATVSPSLGGAPTFLVDTIPPIAPVLNPVSRYTNRSGLRISGSAEAGSAVRIYQNGDLLGVVTAGEDGGFEIQAILADGENRFTAKSEDIAGNVSVPSHTLLATLDTASPVISDVNITPNPAKEGPIDIEFRVSEELQSNPVVSVGGALASFVSHTSPYRYRTIVGGSDPQGETPVAISVTDLAGNTSNAEAAFTVDTAAPTLWELSISANPVRAGPFTATFETSEPLLADPRVSLLGRSLSKASQTGNRYTYEGEVLLNDDQGPTTLAIALEDPAHNTSEEARSVSIDTITPEFRALTISPNPAKAGTVTVTFEATEALASDPTVMIGGFPAQVTGYQLLVTGPHYTFTREVQESEANGQATISISGSDLAGNAGRLEDSSLVIDTTRPELRATPAISPLFAKEGARVSIAFETSEKLTTDPQVTISGLLATRKSKSGNSYIYEYAVSRNDVEGSASVSIELTDLAGNRATDSTGSFVVDFTEPTFTVSASPNPAKAAAVSITAISSEPLRETPSLNLILPDGGNVGISLSPDSGSSNTYRGTYTVSTGQNGEATIQVTAEDRARNSGAGTATFVMDTTPPEFLALTNNIVPLDENGVRVTSAGEVNIEFRSSEPLILPPTVTVNGNSATSSSSSPDGAGTRYTYRYTVTAADAQGLAAIRILGRDPAGNETDYTTASSNEPQKLSFKIDTERPLTTLSTRPIAGFENLGIVSSFVNPPIFTPDLNDTQDTTTFYYRFSEPLRKATVKIFKMLDDSETLGPFVKAYAPESSVDANRDYQLEWDGRPDSNGAGDNDRNGFVDPGEYAFVIETEDYAGNVGRKKAGTVWVQDYKKTLTGELRLGEQEKVFNSTRDSVTLKYRLTTDNKITTKTPREFSPLSVVERGSGERMGYLFCDIYNAAGVLVVHLVDRREIKSGEEGDIVWDKPGVPDGRYRFVFWFEDFTGRRADLLVTDERASFAGAGDDGKIRVWVTVDNAAPALSGLSAWPLFFSPNGALRGSSQTSTTLSYSLQDNLLDINPNILATATVVSEVYRTSVTADNKVVTLDNTIRSAPSSPRANRVDLPWDGKYAPDAFVGVSSDRFKDGYYILRVTATDLAGNSSSQDVGFYVDTMAPTGSVSLTAVYTSGATKFTNTQSPPVSISASDGEGGNGVVRLRISNQNRTGTWTEYPYPAPFSTWALNAAGPDQGVYIQFRDGAGNWSGNEDGTRSVSDSIHVDVDPPAAPVNISIDPNVWTPTNSFTVRWTNPNDLSGISGAYYKWGDAPSSAEDGTLASGSNLQSLTVSSPSLGARTLWVWLKDNVGNISQVNHASVTAMFDNLAPNALSLSYYPDHGVPDSRWNSHGDPYIYWDAPADPGGSGVSYYEGQIDSGGWWRTSGAAWHGSPGDGTHTISFRAIDSAGNTGPESGLTYSIDTRPAALTSIGASPSRFKDSTTFSASFDESVTARVYVNGSEVGSWGGGSGSYTWSAPGYPSSDYSWHVAGTDRAGNVTSAGPYPLTIDRTPPSNPGAPSPSIRYVGAGSRRPTWNWGASDATTAAYQIVVKNAADQDQFDGQIGATTSWTVPFDLVDGIYYFNIRARDDLGNWSGWVSTGTNGQSVFVDNQAPNTPSVSVSNSVMGTWTPANTPVFSWGDPGDNGSAGVSYYQRSIDGGTWDTFGSGSSITLSDGEHWVYIRAVDRAGNKSDSGSDWWHAHFYIDATPPVVTSFSANNLRFSDNSTVTAAFSESVNATVYANGQNIGTWSGQSNPVTWTAPGLGSGTYPVYIVGVDRAGNSVTSSTINLVIDRTPPSGTISVSGTNNPYTRDRNVSLSPSASDQGIGSVVQMRFGDSPDVARIANPVNYSGSYGWTLPAGDGAKTVYVCYRDDLGNWSEPIGSNVITLDQTDPTVSISTPAANEWRRAAFAIRGTATDANFQSYDLYYSVDNGGWQFIRSHAGQVSADWLADWDVSSLNSNNVRVRLHASDLAGRNSETITTFHVDNVSPAVSGLTNASFNPYLAALSGSFNLSDNLDSGATVTAQVKLPDGTLVKTLIPSERRNNGTVTFTWDGTNNSNDYVNEGVYRLDITATDSAGNPSATASANVTLLDDITISYSSLNDQNPQQSGGGGTKTVQWDQWYRDDPRSATASVGSVWFHRESRWANFSINYNQSVNIDAGAGGSYSSWGWQMDGGAWRGDSPAIVSLTTGSHQIGATIEGLFGGDVHATANYMVRQWKRQTTTASPPWGTWSPWNYLGIVENSSPSTRTSITNYEVRANANRLEIRKLVNGNWSPWVKINSPNTGNRNVFNPDIDSDGQGGATVVWEYEYSTSDHDIYFQRVPANFAPFNSTATITLASVARPTQSLTRPELISPKAGAKVTTLRPTFEWYGVQNRQEYLLELSQTGAAGPTGSLTGAIRNLRKIITPTEAASVEADKGPRVSYTIHEFDEGLGRGNWFWRVTANPSLPTVSTSEVESFEIDPPLTISGVTNYPNPFNANAERTRIRYRLSRDADVSIRIYDITGALVRELNFSAGFTGGRGEGASVFDKYDDVEWDGRNGVGDIVVNGIYPFEVAATASGTTVRGRGKIAVLK